MMTFLVCGFCEADDQCQNSFRSRDYDRTILECTNLLNTGASQDKARTYCTRADAYLNKMSFKQAIQDYDECIGILEGWHSVEAKDKIARAWIMKGNAYAKLKKNDEAAAAFTKAAELSSNPAQAYFNLCATQYNSGNTDGAEAACDKAIAADPSKADAYFIKGSLGIAKGQLNAHNKWVFPDGTVDALKKYLRLAPNGAHEDDVKAMLEMAGIKQD